MPRPQKLNEPEISVRLQALPEWRQEGGALVRELEFANFVQAFGFMTQVALLAEAHDHHPEFWNVYKRVKLSLSTHDAAGITELDFTLAGKISKLV